MFGFNYGKHVMKRIYISLLLCCFSLSAMEKRKEVGGPISKEEQKNFFVRTAISRLIATNSVRFYDTYPEVKEILKVVMPKLDKEGFFENEPIDKELIREKIKEYTEEFILELFREKSNTNKTQNGSSRSKNKSNKENNLYYVSNNNSPIASTRTPPLTIPTSPIVSRRSDEIEGVITIQPKSIPPLNVITFCVMTHGKFQKEPVKFKAQESRLFIKTGF